MKYIKLGDIYLPAPKDGQLLVVQDMRKLNDGLRRGIITLEEHDLLFANDYRTGKVMNGPDAELFRSLFGDSVPFFTGGSNLGTIAGHNRRESRRMLQLRKMCRIQETVLPKTQFLYDIGHLAEEYIAQMCAKQMRSEEDLDLVYVPCEFGLINTNHPTFLAHIDGFLIDRATRVVVALVEVKTSQKNSPDWQEKFCSGLVPDSYNDQVQGYAETVGLDDCYVFAHSKHADGPDDFVRVPVKRDRAEAIALLDKAEQFVYETAAGIEYSDEELTADEASAVFAKGDPKKAFKKLPRKLTGTLEKIERIEKDKAALNEDVKETNAQIRRLDAEKKKLLNPLLSIIKDAPGGYLETSRATYRIEVSRKPSLTKDVLAKFAQDEPEAHEKLCNIRPLASCSILIKPKEADQAGFGENQADNNRAS